MKKIFVAILCIVAFTQDMAAQKNTSIGVEIAIPNQFIEDDLSPGIGFSFRKEYSINDNSNITGQIGLFALKVKLYNWNDDGWLGDNAFASMMPIQLGYKYYLNSNKNGFYGHGQLGLLSYKIPMSILGQKELTNSIPFRVGLFSNLFNPSITFGSGYKINDSFNIGVSYNIILVRDRTYSNLTKPNDSDWGYWGLKAGYSF